MKLQKISVPHVHFIPHTYKAMLQPVHFWQWIYKAMLQRWRKQQPL